MKNNIFCSVRHRIVSTVLAISLALSGIIAVDVTQPVAVEAKMTQSKCENNQRVVKKADDASANWIYDRMLSIRETGKKCATLYIQGTTSMSKAKKIVKSLQKKVKALDGQGTTFTYSMGKKFSDGELKVTIKSNVNVYLHAQDTVYDSVSTFEAEIPELANQLDAQMTDINNYTEYSATIKGSKNKITSAMEKLQNMIGDVNTHGVIVKYSLTTISSKEAC